MRKVRKLRHWKQRFNKNASFIWRRAVTWEGAQVKLGEPIPEKLDKNKAKLRRFWEAGVIELAEFDEPTNVLTGTSEKTHTAESMVSFDETLQLWKVHGVDNHYPDEGDALAIATALIAGDITAEEASEVSFLIGSDLLDAEYEIEGETITAGDIVRQAFEGSGLSVQDWNALDDEWRDQEIIATLTLMEGDFPDDEDDEDDWLEDDED